MIEEVPISAESRLDAYRSVAQLSSAVRDLEEEARHLAPRLQGRRVWMVNSTAQGGGVAEMLPRMVGLMNELGVETRWLVIGTERQEFFPLTKKLHNLIHGAGDPELNGGERELFETVSKELAAEIQPRLSPEDILVIHDPQPAGMGAKVAESIGLPSIWRCHIGLDERTPQTSEAWRFLQPYLTKYDRAVFTAPEYIPGYLTSNVSIIHPGLDPLSHKNRSLSTHKLVGILCDAQLLPPYGPLLTPPFSRPAQRLQADGRFAAATLPEDLGLLFRPIVTQVSRWDRLKGFKPLLEGFAKMKSELGSRARRHSGREPRTLQLARLVLAGPDPESIQDDPEGMEVFQELADLYQSLPVDLQSSIVILSLPMVDRKENALMVNALQRCSSLIVQNSLREGFGLTATEGMWKQIPVLATNACGLRQQIRHEIDGLLLDNAEDTEAIANAIEYLLTHPFERERMAASAERRAHDEFLVFKQVAHWLRECVTVTNSRRGASSSIPWEGSGR